MAKFVKSSVLAALNLINSKALVASSGRFLRHIRFPADPKSQQTNHAAKSATGCFLERAAADWTR
jgi:hypothetical protein